LNSLSKHIITVRAVARRLLLAALASLPIGRSGTAAEVLFFHNFPFSEHPTDCRWYHCGCGFLLELGWLESIGCWRDRFVVINVVGSNDILTDICVTVNTINPNRWFNFGGYTEIPSGRISIE
jgi:hypothetical protein